jgi:hypothetical protein
VSFIYRVHAVERMFQRDIEEISVEHVVINGEIIERYTDDKPYASYLSLGFVDEMPLHVVYAKDEEENFIVITVYVPSDEKWENDMRTRRSQK